MSTATRPTAPLDADNRPVETMWWDQSMLADNNGGTTLIYIGKARPGSAASSAVWQIRMLTYDANGNVTQIAWPQNASGNPSNDYQFSWSLRATYTYGT